MLHLHNHQPGKALTGPNGYRRLARLVVRTFYGGECPPREPEEEAPAPSRSRAVKHYYPGLGVLCVDLLAAQDGFMDEEEICKRLRLSQKHVRQALRYLEDQGVLAFQDAKFKKARQKADAANGGAKGKGGDQTAGAGKAAPKSGAAKLAAAAAAAAEEEEEPVRKETKVFWCVDYPRLKDGLRLRLHRVREFIKEQVTDSNPLQDYLCPTCGARYTSLDVHRLLDFTTGSFKCEDCHGELVQHVEGGKAGAGEEAKSRKELAKRFKDIQGRLEAVLRPITEQLEKLKDVDPPDWGSVQDWILEVKEAEKRRDKRDRDRLARAAEIGKGEVPHHEWLDKAEVQVNFGGPAAMAAAAAAEPGKEVPAWFRTGAQGSGLASNTTSEAEPSTAATGAAAGTAGGAGAVAAAADDAAADRRRIEEAYLQQYLADVARRKATGDGGGDEKKDIKRVKTEARAVLAEVKPEPTALKPEPEAGGSGWQQIQAPAAPQAQLQEEDLDGLGQWEDVEPKQEGGGGAAPVDDDFEWEDA